MGPRARMIAGLIPPAITSLVLIWFISTGQWNLVGIWVEPSVIGWSTGFADLANVTATADCLAAGAPVEDCDPYGRPFQPYVVLPGTFLALFGLGLTHTGYLGIGLAIIWVALNGAFSSWVAARWRRSNGELIVTMGALTLAGIAPPSLLGVERGTLDIVVVALSATGLLLAAASERLAMQIAASMSLFLSVIIKYFAIGVFAAFIAPQRWRLFPILAAAASSAFLIVNFSDLEIARETSKSDLPSTTRILFSSTTGLVTLLTSDPNAFFPAEGEITNMASLRIVGALIVLAFIGVFLFVLRSVAMPPNASWLLITGGGFLVLIPYFLGDSNDYRLMALMLPLAGILRWRSSASGILWIPAILIILALITGSAMLPNEFGFLMPKPALVLGDLALAGALGFVAAVWLRQWFPGATSLLADSSESSQQRW